MKHFFKTQKIWIICFSIITIITLTLLLIKTDYELYSPACLTKVESFIEINQTEETEDEANISTIAIYSFPNTSVFNYIIGRINPFADLYKVSKDTNTSNEYIVAQGNLHKNLSVTNAIISAYKEAGYEVRTNYRGYTITTITNYCQSDIEIGDIITMINGVKLTEDTDVGKLIKDLSSAGAVNFNAKIIRDNKEMFINLLYNDEGKFGFAGESAYTYPTIVDGPQFKIGSVNTLGPSGGLMQALYVYEQLTGCKLTKNLKIAGTGTIDVNGNAGLIGGMKQKIYIANASDVDVFFVPVDMSYDTEENQNKNYNEAKEAMETLAKFGQKDMKIYPVRSLADIISYLEGLQ